VGVGCYPCNSGSPRYRQQQAPGEGQGLISNAARFSNNNRLLAIIHCTGGGCISHVERETQHRHPSARPLRGPFFAPGLPSR
jgi:hypothetical protein